MTTIKTPSPAQWLKDLPLTPKDAGFVGLLLELRQETIDLDVITTVLGLAEADNAALVSDVRMKFLHLVAEYHGNTQRKLKDAEQWNDLGKRFDTFHEYYSLAPEIAPMLDFYAPNYALLSYRNAGGDSSKQLVPKMFRRASDASAFLTEIQRNEAMGYLQYNVARWLKLQGNLTEALVHWGSGGLFRTRWFVSLDPVAARPYTRAAAAKQVWKARAEFLAYFPGENIEQCFVPIDVFDRIVAEYGEEFLKSASSLK